MIGQTFGNYRILEKRGEGGMGMFFRATDLHLDRIVGLKTLRPELLADPDLRERLHSEARSLARLVHQNIANVLHYLVEDDYHFIVMEYIDGKDLGEVVKESGLIPMDRLAAIVPQICAAVSYAHQKGVIHRDLKPSNIMVTASGEVKVTDFGIAKILGAQSQTRTGVAPGSLHYMAPEQINGAEVDQRSDVYQLGATLYELCTGRRPFVSDNEYELMTMHLNQLPEAPSSANNRVPTVLDSVIIKALAKRPEDRYQSVDELSTAFVAAFKGTTSGVSDKTEYAPARQAPPQNAPRAAAAPAYVEDATSVAPARQRQQARSSPDTQEPPPKRSNAWIFAVLGVILIAVVAYVMLPFGPTDTTPRVEPEPEPAIAPQCSLLISADLPQSLMPSELHKITLTLNHADSGVTAYDVRAVGNKIRESYTFAPTSEVTVAITGSDAEGRAVLSGTQRFQGSPGIVDGTISLTHTPIRKEPVPTEHNLTLSILPVSARQSITRIWIDDREVNQSADFRFKVQPGRRTIRLVIGNDRLTDTITVGSSGSVEKSFFIGSGRGRLSIGAVFPGEGGFADIWLDGVKLQDMGTPAMIDNILEGPHQVQVSQEGFRAQGGSRIVVVDPGGKTELSFDMVPN